MEGPVYSFQDVVTNEGIVDAATKLVAAGALRPCRADLAPVLHVDESAVELQETLARLADAGL
eukprot:6833572-Alexandrium_andersonii.AAC.1